MVFQDDSEAWCRDNGNSLRKQHVYHNTRLEGITKLPPRTKMKNETHFKLADDIVCNHEDQQLFNDAMICL